jgi:molybdopterin-guanine dinucleotide biosynthesis protein A
MHEPLGAILAGGLSTRFGSHKALAPVGGRLVIDRVARALATVTHRVVVITQHAEISAAAGLPGIQDDEPGLGPLGGIVTALRCAAEDQRPGALCVAADMPFVDAGLLHLILLEAAAAPHEMVMPESRGRRGVEPLCAFYPVEALDAARALLASGERAPHRLMDRAATRRLPLAAVRSVGDPDVLFFNLNTREDLDRAERIATT